MGSSLIVSVSRYGRPERVQCGDAVCPVYYDTWHEEPARMCNSIAIELPLLPREGREIGACIIVAAAGQQELTPSL